MTATKGTTAHCLREYSRRFNIVDGVNLLAEFTGVTPATTLGWMLSTARESLPKGLSLLKLRCFLSLVGYEVTNLEVLPASARKLAELVAFDVFTVAEASRALGYTDDKAIFRQTLQVSSGLPADRADRVDTFVQTHDKKREEAKQAWREMVDEHSLRLASPINELQNETEESQVLRSQSSEQPVAAPVLIAFAAQGLELTATAIERIGPDRQHGALEMFQALVGEERLRLVKELLKEL